MLAVYYYDPAEQGDGAFDLYGSTDLSSYYDYLRFVAGIQARSLWDTEVEVGDASRFLTLTAPSEDAGVQLCVTGRLIEDGRGRGAQRIGHHGGGRTPADCRAVPE